MNIIQLQERHVTANGVEKTVSTEPVGSDHDQAWEILRARIAQNPATYAPTSGLRLVLVGGDR